MKPTAIAMLLASLAAPITQAGAVETEDTRRLGPKWRALDRDGDGTVSLQELHPIQARVMAAHDADANGDISLLEYVSFDLDPGNAAAKPIPENVTLVQDLPYAGTSDPRQRLDIMLPANRLGDQSLPVIAYVHGGGWAMGSKISARTQMLPLVATGRYAAVSIGYRLTWQETWPAQVHDVKAAIRWIRANAARYGMDADRICAFGPSAGGHLVAMLGTTNGESSVEGELGEHRGQSSDVQCVVDFFGPADLRTADAVNQLGGPSMVAQLLGEPPADVPGLAAQASPLVHVDSGDVPFFIVHGTVDPLLDYDQSVALDRALQQAGVSSSLQTIEGGGHGDFADGVPELDRRLEAYLEKIFYDQGIDVEAGKLEFKRPGA